MHILGISAYYHDSAACIVRDGDIIAAAQEERFTRKKHDPSFPSNAIEYCLREAGIEAPESISNVVRTWFATKAQVIAQKHGEALRAAVLLEVLEALRTEIPTKQVLWNAEQRARKRATLDLQDDLVAAGREMIDLINEALSEVTLPEPTETAQNAGG